MTTSSSMTDARVRRASAFRIWLGAGCAVAAIAASTGAFAQDAAADDTVVVTGSRIARTGMTTPTPVTTMSQQELETLSPGTLIEQMDTLPQFTNNTSAENAGSWTTNGGQATLNMRGIGSKRTLVLLDGRRVAPTTLDSTVDINLFPQSLIQRTEVVTGGASAVYGSDAVAGVVNFILDDRFTGLRTNIQYGISDYGDSENVRLQAAGGFEFGRINVVAGAEYFVQDGIDNYLDRDWYTSWGDIAQGPSSAPNRLRLPGVTSRTYTFGGLIPSGPLAGTYFQADGTPAQFVDGQLDYTAQDWATRARPEYRGVQVGGTGDNPALYGLVTPDQERYSLFARATADVTDSITFSLQGIYGYNYINNLKTGYIFYSPWNMTIQRDNVFLPESVRQEMIASGVTSFALAKQVPEIDLLNDARAPLESSMFSVTAALDGEITSDWSWSAYYQFGQSSRDVRAYGYRVDRYYRGVDAVAHPVTGQPVCRSTLVQPDDGCVPINPFGRNNESVGARAWVNGDYLLSEAEITQHAAEVSVNGELFELPAGAVSVAAGASYREDTLDQIGFGPDGIHPYDAVTVPDPTGIYLGLPAAYRGYSLIDRGSALDLAGGYDVKEAFAEALVPVIRDAAFAQRIDLSLAARYADYQGSGGVWAWKVGGDWQITDEFRFRITRSRDIRAGSLSERFNITRTGANITDPANNNEQYQVRTVVGGNPNIMPEIANTITFGGVYQPSFIEGLALSVDYYDIKLEDAIEQIGNQRIVDDCFDFGSFCDQIVRLPNGYIDVINNVFVNVAQSRTRGIDIEASYRTDVSLLGGVENITARVIASHMLEASETPYDAPLVDRAGQAGLAVPWIVNGTVSYRWDDLTVSWTELFYSKSERNTEWVEGVDVVDNDVPAQSQSNLRLTYDFQALNGRDLSLYGAVTNLFNEHPVRGLPGPYSDIGRTYTIGLRAGF